MTLPDITFAGFGLLVHTTAAIAWVGLLGVVAVSSWRSAIEAEPVERNRAAALRRRALPGAWLAVALLAATGAYNASRHIDGISAPLVDASSDLRAFGLIFAGKQILLAQALLALILVTIAVRRRPIERRDAIGIAFVSSVGLVAGALVVAAGLILRYGPVTTNLHH